MMRIPVLVLVGLVWAGNAQAVPPQVLLASFAAEARVADPAFREFSPRRGEAFFRARHGGDWSCSTCHTDNPAAAGRHTVTGKAIRPLAPVANGERFSNPDKVEKWFRRNCKDVLSRACTPGEKGDLLAYLLSIKS